MGSVRCSSGSGGGGGNSSDVVGGGDGDSDVEGSLKVAVKWWLSSLITVEFI